MATRRLGQLALVGAAAAMLYYAVEKKDKELAAKAMDELIRQASREREASAALPDETVQQRETRLARERLQDSKFGSLQGVMEGGAVEAGDVVTRAEILERVKAHCEANGGHFNHTLAMKTVETGASELDVGYACGFGPEACKRLGVENPGRYIDFDYVSSQCIDRSPQRDLCVMDDTHRFCEIHPTLCDKGQITMGVHLMTHLTEKERREIIFDLKDLKPMAMQWSYTAKRCNVTKAYCDSIGLSYAYNHFFDSYDCYLPSGQAFLEDVWLGPSMTRRIRVLWGQTKEGDMAAAGILAASLVMVGLTKVTGGMSLALTPWVFAVPTPSDRSNVYRNAHRPGSGGGGWYINTF